MPCRPSELGGEGQVGVVSVYFDENHTLWCCVIGGFDMVNDIAGFNMV